MGPSYLSTGSNGKAHINVPTRCRLIKSIARRIDDDRADVQIIERVIDPQERVKSHPYPFPIPPDADGGRPPGGYARAQSVAHEITGRIALLNFGPHTAERRALSAHDHIERVL